MFETLFNSALERIYNEMLKDLRLYSKIGWQMLTFPIPFLGMGRFMAPEITGLFSLQADAFYHGLPWAARLLFPNTLPTALPWLACMACGVWLVYTTHILKKYTHL